MRIPASQIDVITPIREWIPKRVRELRDRRGYTQLQVARIMDCDPSRVGDLESLTQSQLKHSKQIETITRFCAAVGVSLAEFFEGAPRPTKSMKRE